jgi:streptogramin lyase
VARARVGARTCGARARRWTCGSLVVGGLWLTWPACVAAAPTITKFSAGLNAGSIPSFGIAAGSDGNVWFTDRGGTAAIGRVTPAGAITEFSAGLNAGSAPQGITAGPDGNLWFTDDGSTPATGRITPAGAITEFSAGLSASSYPTSIAPGSDGNVWFGNGGSSPSVGRITPTGVITEFTAGLAATSNPYGVAAGPDGNTWFADSCSPAAIGRVTTAGVIDEFSAGLNSSSCPYFIAAGMDGSLWFTDEGTTPAIGRITPAGAISEFSAGLDASDTPYGIAPGGDGNVWFTTVDSIGRITTGPGVATGEASGMSSTAATLNGSVRPNSQLTTFQFQFGADANYGSQAPLQLVGDDAAEHPVSAALTGLSPSTTYHYRLVATNDSDTSSGADRSFTTAPAAAGAGPSPAPAKASFAGLRSPITVSRKRRFSFSFHGTPALKGTAVFKTVKRVRITRTARLTLADKSFTIPPTGKVTLRIRLSRRSFRALTLNRRLRTSVTVTLKDAAALTSTASKTITLKAPKRKRRAG